MANVFEVSWLVKKCYDFFVELLNGLDTENFEDQHYLFEEAMYMWVTLKDKNFVEIVMKKFSSEIVKCDQFFVPRYLNDLSLRTTKELDVVIEMVGERKHVLMKVLIDDIGKNSESISANSRYCLENMSYTVCICYKTLHEKLCDTIGAIKNPSNEDFGILLKFFRESASLNLGVGQKLPGPTNSNDQTIKKGDRYVTYSNLNLEGIAEILIVK